MLVNSTSPSCFSPCATGGTLRKHPIAVALYIIAMAAVITLLATDMLAINEKLILGCSAAGAHVLVAIPYFCYRSLQSRKREDSTLEDKSINQSFTSYVNRSRNSSHAHAAMIALAAFIDKLVGNHVLTEADVTDPNEILIFQRHAPHQIPTLTRCAQQGCWLIKVENLHTRSVNIMQLKVGANKLVTLTILSPDANRDGGMHKLNESTEDHQKQFSLDTQDSDTNEHASFLQSIFSGINPNYKLHTSPVEVLLSEWQEDRRIPSCTIKNPNEINTHPSLQTIVRQGKSCFIKMKNKQNNTIHYAYLQPQRGGAILYSIWSARSSGDYAPARGAPESFRMDTRLKNPAYLELQQIFQGTHAIYELA